MSSAPDTIRITGIRGYGYHGALDAERTLGQTFIVDIALRLDAAAAAREDELTRTVDYGSVATAAHDRITGPAVALIETLAEQIAADCLAHEAVAAVEVTVHKPQAPVAVPYDDISISVQRPS